MDSRQFSKKICSLAVVLAIAISMNAQHPAATSLTEGRLRDSIAQLDSIIPTVKKKEARIDSLMRQVRYMDSLVNILDMQIADLHKTIAETPRPETMWPMSVLADDESVFKITDVSALASALKQRCEPVAIVGEIDSLMVETDTIISKIVQNMPGGVGNLNELISAAIDKNVKRMLSLFQSLKEVDTASLSTRQTEYIEELKKKYNELGQYY